MFRIYFLTFEGNLNAHFQNYGGKQKITFYLISLWDKNGVKKNSCLLTMNNNQSTYFLSKSKYPSSNNSLDWNEFLKNAAVSVNISYFVIFIQPFLHKPIYSSLKISVQKGPKRILWDKILNGINHWSYNRAYIDAFNTRFFVGGIRGIGQYNHFVDRRVIGGMTNGVGVISFIIGEGIKYIGGGHICSYLFLYLAYVSVFLLVYYLLF
uniref:NAD(P)H-quinone oxidoreductase subunit 5, chloroplastic n=1 Tax=Solanum lycopersicum TaxID=4081 RepID=K4AUQ4_SOLLC